MKWISFLVVTFLYILTAVKAEIHKQETDKTIAFVFLAICSSIWGGSIIKFISSKTK